MTSTPPFMAAGLSGDYDLVFPLGASELCSFALKLYGLQRTPSFFDEVSDMPLSERTRLLTEGLGEADCPKDDASARLRALASKIESSGRVLAVYVVAPDEEAPSDDELKNSLADLRRRFPRVAFEFLLATSRRGCSEDAWRAVSEGIAAVTSDYHGRSAARGVFSFGYDPRALAAIFSGMRLHDSAVAPKDGNGVEEWGKSMSGGWHRKCNRRLFGSVRLLRFKIRKHAPAAIPLHGRETRICSLRLGRNAWVVVRQRGPLQLSQMPRANDENVLVGLRLALARILQAPLLLLHGLRVKRKKFEHFLMLGYNCELAYRFIMANGFLDSTFFAWAGEWRFGIMLDALRHFDALFTGELAFVGGGDLLVDVNTGISMHARQGNGYGSSSQDGADLEAAKDELRSRARHLREKFYRQLRDDETTLAVVKMGSCDCPRGDSNARELVEQLKRMGGRNFRLLVICQKADARFFPKDHPDYDLRTVACFNPDWIVASEHVGDRLGWMRIWREFAPARKIVQNKTYKFQKKDPR